MTTKKSNSLNTINIINSSGLNKKDYTVWVAGFIQAKAAGEFYLLNSDGSFTSSSQKATRTKFYNVDTCNSIAVPDVTNYGNNRLFFTVTTGTTAPDDYYIDGYTAYPFKNAPGVCPPGPYDIFEFGPNAQYDVSAVDSFGLNLSFTVENDTLTYGVRPSVARQKITTAFNTYSETDPYGSHFKHLLYTSPTGDNYPEIIDNQFSAIVSPKDWLAIYPNDKHLHGYWDTTTDAVFTDGNELNFYLNGATIGNYSGKCHKGIYTLTGPKVGKDQKPIVIQIPKTDFTDVKPFLQAVRAKNGNETGEEYAAFGQIEAALFEAFSRGVVLDGVINEDVKARLKKDSKSVTDYSSNAWINTDNWYSNHANALNGNASVYDGYAKFFHTCEVDQKVEIDPKGEIHKKKTEEKEEPIFGQNSAKLFSMAYGFSLDENPNVGDAAWPASKNVPAKTPNNIGDQTVTITIGPWS